MSIDSENFGFWMKPVKITTKDNEYWAKARILLDKKTKQQYVDVLSGKKGRNKAHIHAGFEIQTNRPLFMKSRNIIKTLRREVTSRDGRKSDERLNLKNTEGAKDLRLVLEFNSTTKEVTIKEFVITPVRMD